MSKLCKFCNLPFNNINGRVFSNHVRWCKQNPQHACYIEKNREFLNFGRSKKVFEYRYCYCGNFFLVNTRSKKIYCSRRCASKFTTNKRAKEGKYKQHSFRNKISLSLKEYYRNRILNNLPLLTKTQQIRTSSYGERLIRKFFKINFPEDGWTYGGAILIDDKRIARDLYSNKLKICIEYDGIWHFEDIKNQLRRKIEIDNCLQKWCRENEFRLIRIDEDLFLRDKKKYLKELIHLVYKETESLYIIWSEENRRKRQDFIESFR
jgi:hypothetical protein